jgi:hypothetical protein
MKLKTPNKMTWFKPIPINKTKPMFKIVPIWNKQNTKGISKKNLTYSQAIIKYPKITAFGDIDKDGKLNMFDCRPFDKKRHSKLLEREIATRIFGNESYSRYPTNEGTKNLIKRSKEESHEKVKLHNKYYQDNAKFARAVGETYKNKEPIKHAYPQFRKGTSKIVTEADIVKTLAKNPELISKAEKVKWKMLDAQQALHRGVGGDYGPQDLPVHMRSFPNEFSREQKEEFQSNPNNQQIRIASATGIKVNLNKTIRHELGHHQQKIDKTFDKLEEQEGPLLETKNRKIEEEYMKQFIDDEGHELEASEWNPNIYNKLPWKERPIEIDAEEKANVPSEKQLAKESGPKPEALKELDKPEVFEELDLYNKKEEPFEIDVSSPEVDK